MLLRCSYTDDIVDIPMSYVPLQVELTPMAIAAGRRLSDRLFGGVEDAKADYTNVPVSFLDELFF